MATRTNLEYTIGETWVINLFCQDGSGAPLDLTGCVVQFRIALQSAIPKLVFDLSTGNGVTVIGAPVNGEAEIIVTPAMQSAAGAVAAVYSYEARVTLPDGSISDQTYGNLNARCSLFAEFP